MPKHRPEIERFAGKTERLDSGCVQWTGYIWRNGYGKFHVGRRGVLAHRWAYEFYVGPIPDGLVIDHLCRNRACVNPEHLEPVTVAENTRRGIGPRLTAERKRAITHCVNGHPFSDENTHVGPRGRTCRACRKQSARESYLRNRELVIERSRLRRENKKVEAA